MCILAQKGTAWDIIDNALKKGNNSNIEDVLHVYEMILCFEAWINKQNFGQSMIIISIRRVK